MGVLLEASNAERQLRSRVRAASTIEGALLALTEVGNSGQDERQEALDFSEFPDCQLFAMSDGEASTDSETEQELKESSGENKGKDQTGNASSEAEPKSSEEAKLNEAKGVPVGIRDIPVRDRAIESQSKCSGEVRQVDPKSKAEHLKDNSGTQVPMAKT